VGGVGKAAAVRRLGNFSTVIEREKLGVLLDALLMAEEFAFRVCYQRRRNIKQTAVLIEMGLVAGVA
jgi:hypothetical protein